MFLHDSDTGSTIPISSDSSGATSFNGDSRSPSISDDGLFVVFHSSARNLAAEHEYNRGWCYVYSRADATLTPIHVTTLEEWSASATCERPTISGDGRYVAFEMHESNFGKIEIFLYDRISNTSEQITHGEYIGVVRQGAVPPYNSYPALSYDGRYIAFQSFADNLVSGDTNGEHSTGADVFVFDRIERSTERVSVTSSGQQVTKPSGEPIISRDGRFIAFRGLDGNLDLSATAAIPPASPFGGVGFHEGVFLHDRLTKTTKLVSVVPANTTFTRFLLRTISV